MLIQSQTVSQLPVVAGVEIPLDDEGRYNLNALHRAYEAKENVSAPHKAPAQWVRHAPAKDFIDEVRKQNASKHSGTKSTTYDVINVVNGGNNPGTFAHELIAVEYAGWISPKFRILVNQTFIDYRTGKLVPAQQTPVVPKDPLLAAIYQANMAVCQLAVEMDDAKQRLSALEEKTDKVTSVVVSTTRNLDSRVKRHEQILSHRDPGKKFNVTHIGSLLGISARETNKLLEKAGLQMKLTDANGKSRGWEVLPAGKQYGRQNQAVYDKNGTPYNPAVSWSEEVVDVLAAMIK